MDMSEPLHLPSKLRGILLPGIVILLCMVTALACGCSQPSGGTGTPTPTATTPGMANPAAVYCTAQGMTYEIRTNTTDGSQYGVCILKDGTVCDEWAYYRKECPASAGMANPAAVYCTQQGMTSEIRTNTTDGSQYGVCILKDGTVCDEWAYFRKECPASAGIANPSAVYCEGQGLKYETRTNQTDGSQYGVCILKDGTVCDAWAYYRKECP